MEAHRGFELPGVDCMNELLRKVKAVTVLNRTRH